MSANRDEIINGHNKSLLLANRLSQNWNQALQKDADNKLKSSAKRYPALLFLN